MFVGGGLTFGGYTGGGGKDVVAKMTATGDMGYFDEAGRLFIVGREDDMIVSGGENVYPSAVENALGKHPDVADHAVIGVPDEDFGQRLAAFVVPRPGADIDRQQHAGRDRGAVQQHGAGELGHDQPHRPARARRRKGKIVDRGGLAGPEALG